MAVEAAFTELRSELVRLKELLRELGIQVRGDCPDLGHCVPNRIHDGLIDARGWIRKVLAATRLGLTAVQADSGSPIAQTALTRFELYWKKAQTAFQRQIGGAARLRELNDLAARRDFQSELRRRWSAWAQRVKTRIQAIRQCFRGVSSYQAACWRELAARPTSGLTIMNVALGQALGSRPLKKARKLKRHGEIQEN